MSKVAFRILSEEDLVKIGVTDGMACVNSVEEVFRLVSKGDYLMGGETENEHGIMLCFPQEQRFPGMPVAGPDRRFMAMIGYLGGRFHICGEKWYGSNIDNPVLRGVPRSVHITVLNDVEMGGPVCLMAGGIVSAMRTGGVPGVAARHLSGRKGKILGLVGGGVINKASLLCLNAGLPELQEVKLYDINKEKGQAFCDEMSAEIGKPVYLVDSLEACVRDSDVTHFASAGKVRPRIEAEWVKPGSLVETSSFTDVDHELIHNSNIVVDNWKMHDIWWKTVPSLDLPTFEFCRMAERGEMDLSRIMNLGDIIEGKYPQEQYDNGKTTIFMAEGMIVEDIGYAYDLFKKAEAANIGQMVTLFEEPYWM